MRSVRGPPKKGRRIIGIDYIVDSSEFFFLSYPRLDLGLGPVSYPCKGDRWVEEIALAGFWADVRKLGLNGCIRNWMLQVPDDFYRWEQLKWWVSRALLHEEG